MNEAQPGTHPEQSKQELPPPLPTPDTAAAAPEKHEAKEEPNELDQAVALFGDVRSMSVDQLGDVMAEAKAETLEAFFSKLGITKDIYEKESLDNQQVMVFEQLRVLAKPDSLPPEETAYEVQDSDLLPDAPPTEASEKAAAVSEAEAVAAKEFAEKESRQQTLDRLKAVGVPDAEAYLEKHPKSVELRLAKLEMDAVRERYAKAKLAADKANESNLPRFFGGMSDEQRMALMAGADSAKAEYETWREIYVYERVSRHNLENLKLADAIGEAALEDKGFTGKVREWHRKLGDMNLTSLGWEPTGKIGKAIAKGVSVRTALTAGLAAGGAAMGGGLVAAGLVAAGKGLRGLTSGYASYDMITNIRTSDRSISEEQVRALTNDELTGRMADIQARAMIGGRKVSGNDEYMRMKTDLGRRLSPIDGSADASMMLAELTKSDAVGREKALSREKSADRKTMAAAFAVGVLSGSGAIGKGLGAVKNYFWGSGESAVDAAHAAAAPVAPSEVTAVEHAPNPAPAVEHVVEAKLSVAEQEAQLKLAQVRAGDGYSRIIHRQLGADPKRFGYDAAHDGDKQAWINKKVLEIEKKNGIVGNGTEMRLRFNGKEPSYVVVNDDLTIGKHGVEQYAHSTGASHDGIAAAEQPHAAAPAPRVLAPENHPEVQPDKPFDPFIKETQVKLDAARAAARASEAAHDAVSEPVPEVAPDVEAGTSEVGRLVLDEKGSHFTIGQDSDQGVIRFLKNGTGRITDFTFTYEGKVPNPYALLKVDYYGIIEDHDKSDINEVTLAVADGDIRDLMVYKRFLQGMLDKGQKGGEVNFLRGFIAAKQVEMAKQYGDIFK